TVFSQMYFDPRYKPSIIQKRMVDANLLGRKTGKGFYDYNQPALNPQPLKDENTGEEIFFRILSMLINEAAETVYLKIASVEDIDLAMTRGVNYPKGLLRWADEIGIEKVVNKLQSLFDEYNEERYRTSTLLKKMIREKKKFYNE
ncbi:MAG: 3-hydroxyacyl-CoA dehydrogenase family protein, partial [Bacteroidota bacterium]